MLLFEDTEEFEFATDAANVLVSGPPRLWEGSLIQQTWSGVILLTTVVMLVTLVAG